MEGIKYRELTQQIISAAITVHRELGPGFLESIYEESLSIELGYRGIQYERQKEVNILYKGQIGRAHV